jgi:hypothetical protein
MQINIPIVPAIIFGVATSFIIFANMVFYSILGEVNGKRSPEEHISMFFVNIKASEVMRLHKELFPESQKPRTMWILAIVGFALGFLSYLMWINSADGVLRH